MTFFKNNFDFLAIGDIVIDDFIKLKEGEVEAENKNGQREICLSFGDKIPYESSALIPAVGNSPNAAVAAARLGLKTALVSNLGDDEHGKLCLETLETNRVNTKFVTKHSGLKTNYHYVLWYKDDRTILIKHEQYPYKLPAMAEPKWIYLSSLGENSLPFHDQIIDYLEAHPNINLAFQPGTYQMRFGTEKLARIYKRSKLFFCNKDEAKKITGLASDDIKTLAEAIKNLGPKIVFITDGRNGAYSFDGEKLLFMPIYPDPKPPVERTGAGDAFSSTTTAFIHLGLSTEDAMKHALVNSMSVVQQIGAQAGLLSKSQIEEYLVKAPADYSAKII